MSMTELKEPSRLCAGHELPEDLSRRGFLSRFGHGVGAMALANLLASDPSRARAAAFQQGAAAPLARAKRVIFLFQAGAPSQMDPCTTTSPA